MAGRDIIVIGASAGGFEPLLRLAEDLPAGLPATVLVAMHTGPDNPGILPEMLSRVSKLRARYPVDGDSLVHGTIMVAPADHHLLVEGEGVSVTRGPRENGFRPAIDPLFRTAAAHHGPRVTGVVLSGGLNDGTYGLMQIKHAGGVAVVQRVEEAIVKSMPLSAIRAVEIDHIVGIDEMAPLLARLARTPAGDGGRVMPMNRKKRDPAVRGTHALHANQFDGPPSAFTCPECGGALWEKRNGHLVRFSCHVGHSYTAEGLVAEQHNGVEMALWSAVRALEEHAELHRRLAHGADERGLAVIAKGYAERANGSEHHANMIREVLMKDEAPRPRRAAPRRERRIARAASRRR